MTRLIDADAFLEYCKPYPHVYQVMRSVLKQLPIVDAVPVIRCKDCKWNSSNNNWVDCPITEMFGRTTDNYCSRAERKEE